MHEIFAELFKENMAVQSAILNLGISITTFVLFGILIAIVALVIKGFALWYSARNYQFGWFVALLVINTFGILDLIYLIWFRADKDTTVTPSLFTPQATSAPEESAENEPK